MIAPENWETAREALEAAKPRNKPEREAQASLRSSLESAVRAYKVGTGLHAPGREYPGQSYANLSSADPLFTHHAVDQVRDLVETLSGHLLNEAAHLAKPNAAPPPPVGWVAQAGWLLSTFNAHVLQPGLHFNDASGSTIVAPPDDVLLVNLLKHGIRAHRHNVGSLGVVAIPAPDASLVRASYAARVAEWESSFDSASATLIAAAEVLRSGAAVLGYAPGAAWVGSDYRELQQRFETLRALPGFSSNEYCTAVVEPAVRAMKDLPRPPTAPTTPKARFMVSGESSSAAEAALQTVLGNINEFLHGLEG